jgi:hypothetical protein
MIEKFCEIDPGAAGFRYPMNKDQTEQSLPVGLMYVNLRVLHDTMDGVSNFSVSGTIGNGPTPRRCRQTRSGDGARARAFSGLAAACRVSSCSRERSDSLSVGQRSENQWGRSVIDDGDND